MRPYVKLPRVSFSDRERGAAPAADPDTPEFPTRRSIVAGPVVAAVTLFAALLATHDVGVPFRDPDHVVGKRLALVACGVALLVVLGLRSLSEATPPPPPPPPPTELRSPAAQVPADPGEQSSTATSLLADQ